VAIFLQFFNRNSVVAISQQTVSAAFIQNSAQSVCLKLSKGKKFAKCKVGKK
jgi:hypothetical protein